MTVTGITVKQIAETLGISYKNATVRIAKAKIKPILTENLYPPDTPDKIRDVKSVGRPKKEKPNP
jgi:hypothetical protein